MELTCAFALYENTEMLFGKEFVSSKQFVPSSASERQENARGNRKIRGQHVTFLKELEAIPILISVIIGASNYLVKTLRL